MGKQLENGEQAAKQDAATAEAPTDAAPTDAVDVEAGTESEAEKLATQLAEKDKTIAELNDKYLRTLAESENARKRLRQQGEESVRLQRESLLRGILPVVDNLERAVAAAKGAGDVKSIVEGVAMVLQSIGDFLRNEGVTPLNTVGQTFDPQRHEAMDQIESETHPPNTIVSEFHRGYLIGERMLRPARVTVAKNTSSKGEDSK